MAKGKSKKSTPKSTKKKTPLISRRTRHLMGLGVGLLAILLYLNTLGHQWTLDDASAITNNFVTKQGVEGIGTHFTNSYRYGYWTSQGTLYRPVSLAMFALEWELFGDNPRYFHLFNILFYGLTGYLVFLLLSQWLKRWHVVLPLLAALLYIAHPVHTEVVANVKSRDEIMAMLFGVLSLLCFWKYAAVATQKRPVKWLVGALLAYTLALFSKESAVTLLAIFPLSLLAFAKYYKTEKLSTLFSKTLTLSAPMILPVVLFLAARFAIVGGVTIDTVSKLDNALVAASGGGERLAGAFLYLGYYLKTLVIPHLVHQRHGYHQCFQIVPQI
ncbi:MAG: hypothetical protein AAFO94_14340 [Bacteroidota bacterium]